MAAVVIGGILETLLGIFRLGRYITLVPYSVVSGFMSGIGFIILILQLGPFLGISTRGGVISSMATIVSQFEPNIASVLTGLMTLGVVFLTPLKWRQWVPSPLMALLVITPLSLVFFNDNRMGEIGLEPLMRIGSIPEGGLKFSVPDFTNYIPELLKAGIVLALLGAIDSLLTSLVADNITQTSHDSNRELIGQGSRTRLRDFSQPARCRGNDENSHQHQIRGKDASFGDDSFSRSAFSPHRSGTDGCRNPDMSAGWNPDQGWTGHYRLGIFTSGSSPFKKNRHLDVRGTTDDGVLGSDLGRLGRHVRRQSSDC